MKTDSETMREVVGYFDSAETLQRGIDDLTMSEIEHSDITLVAAGKTVDEKLVHKFRKSPAAGEAPSTLAYIPTESRSDFESGLMTGLVYIGAVAAGGAVVASGGSLAAALTGAAVAGGGGGIVGAALAPIIGERPAREIEDQLHRGGLLLWVRAKDRDQETRIRAILDRHAAGPAQVHAVPAGAGKG